MSNYFKREMIPTRFYYKSPNPNATTQFSQVNHIRTPVPHEPVHHGNRSNIAPNKFMSHHTANTNRVIAFHSSAGWRDYFHASKTSDKLMVIYFTASWCSPCRAMAPVLDEFAAQYTDVEFDKIDVDELFCVSREFGVQAMPAFVFVKRGREIDRVTGARREELQRKIEKHRT